MITIAGWQNFYVIVGSSAGAAALLLLLDGIHNAWDIVRYHMLVRDEP